MTKRYRLNTTLPCRSCNRYTWHDVVEEYQKETYLADPDEYPDPPIRTDYFRLVECGGCGHVSFEHEQHDGDDGSTTSEVFPGLKGQDRQPAARWEHLPPKVRQVYYETLRAFDSRTTLLCAAGVRAVVEAVCQDQQCPGRNLKDRIDALVPKGALSKSQADFLHVLRFLGNDAVHDIAAPPIDELKAAFDIVDSLLRNLYELPHLVALITSGRANRMLNAPADGDQTE